MTAFEKVGGGLAAVLRIRAMPEGVVGQSVREQVCR